MTVNEIDREPFKKIAVEKVFPTVEGKGMQELITKILATKA